jgi:hypothetical protein
MARSSGVASCEAMRSSGEKPDAFGWSVEVSRDERIGMSRSTASRLKPDISASLSGSVSRVRR